MAKVSINIPSIYKVNTPFKRNDYKMQKIFCLLVATTWILANTFHVTWDWTSSTLKSDHNLEYLIYSFNIECHFFKTSLVRDIANFIWIDVFAEIVSVWIWKVILLFLAANSVLRSYDILWRRINQQLSFFILIHGYFDSACKYICILNNC